MLRTLCIAIVAAACATPQERAPVTVLVWNYAGLDGKVVEAMVKTGTKVLGRAGVPTVWRSCAIEQFTGCPELPAADEFWVRIIPDAPSALSRSVGGLAIIGTDASYVTVYAHRILELAGRTGISAGQLLGYTAAHEIGHLLLGPGLHARTGVMRKAWDELDFEAIGRNWLAFQPDEVERMCREIDRRRAMLAKTESANPR